MNKFKKGDWVTHGIELHQVTEVSGNTVKVTNLDILSGTFISMSKFKLWQPQPNEWCWFWSQGFVPHISRFKEMYGDGEFINYYEDKEVITFSSHCEPFIGKLPTFVKDQHDS